MGKGLGVDHAAAAAGGPNLGPRRAALGPRAAAEPREGGVSIRTGGGTEAQFWEAAPEG